MLINLLLAANVCGVTWDPVRVLPVPMRTKLQGAQVVSPCRVASLPPAVQDLLAQTVGQKKVGMADPGKEWNAGCLQREGFANRQLVVAAKAGLNWVVHYRQGGFALVEMAAVFEEDGGTFRQVWVGQCVLEHGQRKCGHADP